MDLRAAAFGRSVEYVQSARSGQTDVGYEQLAT
jgi:hypothetical protein